MSLFKKGLFKKSQEKEKLKTLEQKLKIATACLEKISDGQFEIESITALLNDKIDDNKDFLGTLDRTRNKLVELSRRDHERMWVAQGVSKFMELLSGDQRNQRDFYSRILTLLIHYTETNQGAIFVVKESEQHDTILEMKACYAYGKSKFEEKIVEPGQGMLGQCFLEKQTRVFTNIPKSYTTIASGLGGAAPEYLLLVPLKCNDEMLGVVELASFQKLEPYKIEFIEKTAESIASVVLNLRNSQKVDGLLEESKKKAELLQEKEESLKQNLEELVATQEEMQRHQNELNGQTHLLKFILDNIPFPVFVKDEAGRYALVNKAEAKLFNLDYTDLVGKDDSHFVNNVDDWNVIKESDAHVLASNVPFELPLQKFTTTAGASYIFKTTKIPFVNNVTGKKNILGVSIDLTEKLTLEKELFQERKVSSKNILLNIAGRQRMLSQKIGFYAESLVRGRKQYAEMLRDAIDLHEHSLRVLRYGGMPMDVISEEPLPPIEDELLPHLMKIESLWELYKNAAENILYFASLDPNEKDRRRVGDIEDSISVIEANGELLLKLNNELMLGYMAQSETQLESVY